MNVTWTSWCDLYATCPYEVKSVHSLPYVIVIHMHLCKILCVIMELKTQAPSPCLALHWSSLQLFAFLYGEGDFLVTGNWFKSPCNPSKGEIILKDQACTPWTIKLLTEVVLYEVTSFGFSFSFNFLYIRTWLLKDKFIRIIFLPR